MLKVGVGGGVEVLYLFLLVPFHPSSFPGMAVVTVSCSFSMPFLPLSLASLNSRFVRVAARLFVVVVVTAVAFCLFL